MNGCIVCGHASALGSLLLDPLDGATKATFSYFCSDCGAVFARRVDELMTVIAGEPHVRSGVTGAAGLFAFVGGEAGERLHLICAGCFPDFCKRVEGVCVAMAYDRGRVLEHGIAPGGVS